MPVKVTISPTPSETEFSLTWEDIKKQDGCYLMFRDSITRHLVVGGVRYRSQNGGEYLICMESDKMEGVKFRRTNETATIVVGP